MRKGCFPRIASPYVRPDGSRWRPEDGPTLKNLNFPLRKTSIFEKTHFCIRRRLEATRRGLGKWVHRSGLRSKKACNFKGFLKHMFEASRSAEGPPRMAAGPIHSIFSGFRATSRIASYLQCKRLRGLIIPCKNQGILFRESSAEGRSEDGAFSSSWGVPWGPRRSPKEVLKIRGSHQSGRQLESLRGVP